MVQSEPSGNSSAWFIVYVTLILCIITWAHPFYVFGDDPIIRYTGTYVVSDGAGDA